MNRRNRDMKGIDLCFGRQRNIFNQDSREIADFIRYREFRNRLNHAHSTCRGIRIPGGDLPRNELGNNRFEVGATDLPPLLRKFLIRGGDRIPATPRGKIAYD